jgi:hypothetical protein
VTSDSSRLAEGAAPPGNRRAAALTVCCLGAFMAFLDAANVNFAFPGAVQAGWLFAVGFAIAAGATALLLASRCPTPSAEAA